MKALLIKYQALVSIKLGNNLYSEINSYEVVGSIRVFVFHPILGYYNNGLFILTVNIGKRFLRKRVRRVVETYIFKGVSSTFLEL